MNKKLGGEKRVSQRQFERSCKADRDARTATVTQIRKRLAAGLDAAPKLRVGQRVILPANKKEGWSEERGVVIGVENDNPSVIMVELDQRYRRGRPDDGLRELSSDNVRPEPRRRS